MMSADLIEIAGIGSTAGLSFGAFFVAVRWAANFIAGRLDKKEDRIDAATRDLIESLQRQIERLSDAEKELRAEFTAYRRETDKQLRECERKHAESEAEVMQLRAMLQGYGDAREKAALIVASEKKKEAGR